MMVTKEQLDEYLKLYQLGKPAITDEEYDILLEQYLKEHGEAARPFLRQSQTESVSDIVGTLTKAYGVTTPMRPGQLTYKEWRMKHRFNSEHVLVQPKFDGCSVAYDLKTHRFFTRGDTDNGESVDVTNIFKHFPIYEKNLEGFDAIKFEAIMSKQMFNTIFAKDYKRPRDVVAAAIHSGDEELSKFMNIISSEFEYMRWNK